MSRNASLFGQSQAALVTALLLVLSLIFGGASRDNALQVCLLEVLAFAVLGLHLLGGSKTPSAAGLPPFYLLAAMAAILVLQLVLLPPSLWSALPGREGLAAAHAAAGVAPHWAPISLTPDATLQALLFLAIPTAVFVIATKLDSREATFVAAVVVLIVIGSVVLGVVQIADGADSVLRPYKVTNFGSAVGLFANRNHQATASLLAIPLCAVWATQRPNTDRPNVLRLAIAALAAGILVVGLIVSGSRAGLLLLPFSLAGSLFLIARSRIVSRKLLWTVAAAVVVVVVAVAGLRRDAIIERLDGQQEPEVRLEVAPKVIETALGLSPFGAGFGAFDNVFRSVEPVAAMRPTYINHAHNDYLELWLEGGIPALIVLLAFLIWVGPRIWRSLMVSDRSLSAALRQAGSVMIILVLAHSAVDYPLRTPAIAALFAFACALLTTPSSVSGRRSRVRVRQGADPNVEDKHEGQRRP